MLRSATVVCLILVAQRAKKKKKRGGNIDLETVGAWGIAVTFDLTVLTQNTREDP